MAMYAFFDSQRQAFAHKICFFPRFIYGIVYVMEVRDVKNEVIGERYG